MAQTYRPVPFFSGAAPEDTEIKTLPPSVDELIDELDRVFPERVPDEGDTMRRIQRRAGERNVVLYLKHLRDRRDAADEKPRVQRRSR